jgi:hypothetical protein
VRSVRSGDVAATGIGWGVRDVHVEGFRSARKLSFSPGPLCALVGEARSGKSNLLAAIRAALDPASAPLSPADAAAGGDGRISIRLRLADGGRATLTGTPDDHTIDRPPGAPAVLFLSASARASAELVEGTPRGVEAARALEIFRGALNPVEAIDTCCADGVSGLLLLVEEPELYLRPQAQRYLSRLLREFAASGNQVIYSTHSPAFLNVARLEELVFVERLPTTGTRAFQPEPVGADAEFRVMSEFDAARSELFLARSVVLVEGLTEKLVLPFVFSSLGHDVDMEAVSIIECGGKPNIPLFARICKAAGIPFLAVHDSDRRTSGRLAPGDQVLNALIADTAGEDRVVVLDPDFEAVAGLEAHSHKPEQAWREFAERPPDEMPEQLVRVAELAVSLARQQ